MTRVAVAMLAILALAACEPREGARGPYVGGAVGTNIR